MHELSLLSDRRIKEYRALGEIVIEPFEDANLGNCSYDVRLGKWYYLERHGDHLGLHNPFSKKSVETMWAGPYEAQPLKTYTEDESFFSEHIKERARQAGYLVSDNLLTQIVTSPFENIKKDERVMFLFPHQNMLGHTIEYIGGKSTTTTKMLSRSSMGRNNITVCRDAGKGDVGYIDRWTMEITNNNRQQIVPLVVGSRIAQIEFYY
ncbi:hypothetical protein COT72_02285, partial [archaeon CG10_big_fil_rev_8_21_14_0_10_43_11]